MSAVEDVEEEEYYRVKTYMGWKLIVRDVTPQQGEGNTMAPTTTHIGNAMNYEQAREAFVRLRAAGFGGTIRQRSWDTEGIYFAVEVYDAQLQTHKLYRVSDVDAFLKEHTPLDVEPFDTTPLRPVGKLSAQGSADIRFFRFLAPGSDSPSMRSTFLPAPDGSNYWSVGDIQRVGGVATSKDGRRYRLGERKFVPFVATPTK